MGAVLTGKTAVSTGNTQVITGKTAVLAGNVSAYILYDQPSGLLGYYCFNVIKDEKTTPTRSKNRVSTQLWSEIYMLLLR